MASIFTPLIKIWNQLTRPDRTGSIQGSQYPIPMGRSKDRSTILEIPIRPIRPVLNNLDYSFELLEISSWSYEARHAISCITRDCFQDQEGRVKSWSIAPSVDNDGNELKLNPDILAIGNALKERYNGKDQLLGGNALQRAAREMLFYGDSFLELGFEKEGLSKGTGDWGIAKTLYLPTFQTFVEEDEEGGTECYWQRRTLRPSKEDLRIEPIKMLHFKYEEQALYGVGITFQSLEPWRKLKEASADLENASRAVGVSPWLHIMPDGKDERYKREYAQEHEQLLADGIITNLYLMNGQDVRKASSGDTNLSDLLDYCLDLRRQMIPPGLPAWLFPGLGKDDRAQDLQGQPALAYARMIAAVRGLLGEQIKWAINVELILKKGYDWWLENNKYDIVWGDWELSTLESAMAAMTNSETPTKAADEEVDTQADRLIKDAVLILSAPSECDLPHMKALLWQINAIVNHDNLSYSRHKRLKTLITGLENQRTLLGASTNGKTHTNFVVS
jgi:hypothetical protein